MVRRLLPLVALAAALTAGSAAAAGRAPVCTGACFSAPAGSGALFVFTGHGWGHGVGMSQYGAYGYAQHGATFDQILSHYYLGTRGAEGTGGRRAVVRARDEAGCRAVRRLFGHAQPDVPRYFGRVAGGD